MRIVRTVNDLKQCIYEIFENKINQDLALKITDYIVDNTFCNERGIDHEYFNSGYLIYSSLIGRLVLPNLIDHLKNVKLQCLYITL